MTDRTDAVEVAASQFDAWTIVTRTKTEAQELHDRMWRVQPKGVVFDPDRLPQFEQRMRDAVNSPEMRRLVELQERALKASLPSLVIHDCVLVEIPTTGSAALRDKVAELMKMSLTHGDIKFTINAPLSDDWSAR